jgi:hypothetical protein
MSARIRQKAARELVRVARPGAPIFVSVMNRFTVVDGLLNLFPQELEAEYSGKWVSTGDYGGTVYGKRVFAPFHGFTFSELEGLFKDTGFNEVCGVGLEGFGSRSNTAVERLFKKKKLWDIWFRMHIESATDPSLIGASAHMMIIGRKGR